MGFMQWKKEFEIGIPEMDSQHKKWLELLNNFYNQISQNKDFNNEIKKLINEVVEYTNFHFTEEEKLMTQMGYPAIAEQKEMHKEISNNVREFKRKIENGENVLSISVTNKLKSWFNQHILIEDKKYAKNYYSKLK